jgi:hypothetical protein
MMQINKAVPINSLKNAVIELIHTHSNSSPSCQYKTNIGIKVGTGNATINVDGIPAFLWIMSDHDWDPTGDP